MIYLTLTLTPLAPDGVMTLSINTFIITALSIKGLFLTLSLNDTQHTNNLYWVPLSCVSFFWLLPINFLLCWMSLCRVPWHHLVDTVAFWRNVKLTKRRGTNWKLILTNVPYWKPIKHFQQKKKNWWPQSRITNQICEKGQVDFADFSTIS
jgi:hypothetical protein